LVGRLVGIGLGMSSAFNIHKDLLIRRDDVQLVGKVGEGNYGMFAVVFIYSHITRLYLFMMTSFTRISLYFLLKLKKI
jgi:hypothetical protein